MEIVEIGCPRALNLMSIPLINEKNKDAFKVLETINIYDLITIKQEIKKETGIVFMANNNLSDETKEKMKQILIVFANYVGIYIKDLIIDIKYNSFSYLKDDNSLLAGLLIAINIYFKKYLTYHELIFLAGKVSPFISYYINGGYKKIDINGNRYNIGENCFNKYLLIARFPLDNLEEKERLQKFLMNQNNIFFGIDSCYFIALNDFAFSSIPILLKKEFSGIAVDTFYNVKEPKILIKYLK